MSERRPDPAPAAASILRSPFLWAGVAGLVGLALLWPLTRMRPRRPADPPPPAVIGQIPAFTLTDQAGKAYGSKDLAGRPYVAAFFFTTCQSICPRITQQMGKLGDKLRAAGLDVGQVSLSVDPEADTPAVLADYAAKHQIDGARWRLLTGSRDQVSRLLEGGFRTHMGDKVKTGDLIDIAHTSRFALVDRAGGLRGLFESDDDGLEEIVQQARRVSRAAR